MESWREELYAMDYSNYLKHMKLKGIKNGEGVAYTRLPDGTYVRTEIGKQRKRDRENIKGNGLGAEDAYMKPKAVQSLNNLNSNSNNQNQSNSNSNNQNQSNSNSNNQNQSNSNSNSQNQSNSNSNSQNQSNSNSNSQNQSNSNSNNQNQSGKKNKQNQNQNQNNKQDKSNDDNANSLSEEDKKKITDNANSANSTVGNLNSSIKTIIKGIDDKRIANLPDPDLSSYSNADLIAMTTRADLETKYKKATAPGESKAAKGAKAVTDIMTGAIGAGIAAMAIARVYKILTKD